MSLSKLSAFLVIVLSVASCAASGHWENPNAPVGQWPGDQAACARKANAEAEREMVYNPNYQDMDMGRTDTLGANMARYKAGKSGEHTLDACMRRLGYAKVTNKRKN
ncbi:MAG: hypothetical protein A3G18_10170 [Rhodospirillales bacterium RIFCSPLOWO2_12_FULL_58_28]|nr:MAG: hypothetical protein A3H92_08345 [Rhodospirillales bacterium RIFCSPLOWO2_02_FULL_58_16]OHC77644.1 MAG: hypothetical protein A3G18_10170 [Rhodospirillales bacterium RIFCSPLOWO2_12_FULL_58_28]